MQRRNGLLVRLCTFFLLTVVPCCGGTEHASPQRTVESDSLTAIAQYSPPIPPQFEVGPSRLPRLSHALRKRWPNIVSAAVSPNGKSVAVFDGSRVYLTDSIGKKARRLHVLLREEIANTEALVSIVFRRDNRRVAVLTTQIGGEPIGYTVERLWTADLASGRVRQLRKWEYRVQGSSPVTADRKIEKWATNNKAIIITGTVYEGKEMPTDAHKVGTERVVVKDVPITSAVRQKSNIAKKQLKAHCKDAIQK